MRPQVAKIVWATTAVYWLILALLTHLPPVSLPTRRVGDKLEHVIGYFILGVLLFLSLRCVGFRVARAMLCTFGVALVYGGIDELTQPLVGRICSILDWYADAIGAAIAMFVVALGSLALSRTPARRGKIFC